MALAPAKLNLYLDVLGQRPDGYHDLETLFLALDWGDEVEVRPRSEAGVTLHLAGGAGGEVPEGAENLAARAATAWLEALAASGRNAPAGLEVRLAKRIPVGGGLGGGSSDAGTVLRLANALPGVTGLAHQDLERVARGLGADVPFFLTGGAAVGRGRGDEIQALPRSPRFDVVLIHPPWGHATAQV